MATQQDVDYILDYILGWFDPEVPKPPLDVLMKIADAWSKRRLGPQIETTLALGSGVGRYYQRVLTAGKDPDGKDLVIAVMNTQRPLTEAEAQAAVGCMFILWAGWKFQVRFSGAN